ncbi:hypothetical protein [Leclercia sp.]|uniref:hypothetical protein n=1 Tax=Leclercia sp. TaxID=1898428 RepID=UPI002FDC80B5
MWILIWIVCASAAAGIAGGKGRSSCGWFFIGLLLGIFAMIILACLPAIQPEGTAHHCKCPQCAESLLVHRKFFKYCRSELPTIVLKTFIKPFACYPVFGKTITVMKPRSLHSLLLARESTRNVECLYSVLPR